MAPCFPLTDLSSYSNESGYKNFIRDFILTGKCQENPVVEAFRVENREMLDFYIFFMSVKIRALKGISNLPAYMCSLIREQI